MELTELINSIAPVATLLLFPAICLFAYYVDNREYGKATEEQLYELSKFNNCSEFHLFCLAGEEWRVVRQRVDKDFADYVLSGSIPHYVRGYVRRRIADYARRHKKTSPDKV